MRSAALEWNALTMSGQAGSVDESLFWDVTAAGPSS